MNTKRYKSVFSKRLGFLVAVGENASSQGKANGASSGLSNGRSSARSASNNTSLRDTVRHIGVLTASFMAISVAWATPALTVLPTRGQVKQGEVRPIAIASFCPGNITHAKVVLRSGRINVLVVVRLRFEFVDRN